MAKRQPTDEEVLAALEILWDSPEVQRIKGDLLVKYPDAYSDISWGVAERSTRRVLQARIRRAGGGWYG